MKYQLEYISLNKLCVVWAAAQRPFNKRWGDEIADNFDPDLWEPPMVTLPNGRGIYHIIAGQHRVYAARKALGEDQKVPCHVLPVEEPARAAELFLLTGTKRKAISPLNFFDTAVTAKRVDEVSVKEVATRCGFKIDGSPSEGSIAAVQALLSVHRRYKAGTLEVTLRTIEAIWGKDRNAYKAPIIRGFGAFLGEYYSADKAQLVAVVKRKYPSPGRFHGVVVNAKDMHGGNLTGAAKMVLFEQYNRAARGKRRLRDNKGDKSERRAAASAPA